MREALELALVRAVAGAVRPLPPAAVRACGVGIGLAAYYLDGFHRRVALDNLAHAFPSKSGHERRRVARAMFSHFGSLLLELMKLLSMSDVEILGRVEVEGEERARHAYDRGRGVLVAQERDDALRHVARASCRGSPSSGRISHAATERTNVCASGLRS